MGRLRGTGRALMLLRLAALVAGGLLLANCSNGNYAGKVDPKYGVSASARVIEPGQPVPKGGGTYRVGKPYTVSGRVYVPEENINYSEEGMASWYGDDFHGRYTANGEIFDMNSISAAHPTLPMPSYVRVTNLRNRKSIVVRVNDRGPYANNRIIDLSVQTAKLLGFYGHGLAKVRVEYVGRAPIAGSDDRKLMATLRDGDTPVRPSVQVASAEPYVPEIFDSRPMSKVPSPPDRPYGLNDDSGESEQASAKAAPVVRSPVIQRAALAPPIEARVAAAAPSTPEPPRLTSPVSAYAPVGYSPPQTGFMAGRGLY